jgi:hypothetical protein
MVKATMVEVIMVEVTMTVHGHTRPSLATATAATARHSGRAYG